MKKELTYLSFAYILFIFLLSLSGSIGYVWSFSLYILSFAIPIAVLFLFRQKNISGTDSRIAFIPSSESVIYTLPLIFPVIAVVFLVSFLTDLLLSKIGPNMLPDVSGNLFYVILRHALIPSVFEEILFRYFPLLLLLPYSKRGAVLVSSLMFALAHGNLYQIPYAFIAGLIFGVIDISLMSLFPSFLIHFLNNIVSVLWLRSEAADRVYFILTLLALAVLSFAVLIVQRKKYRVSFKDERKIKEFFTPALGIYIFFTLSISVLNLFWR